MVEDLVKNNRTLKILRMLIIFLAAYDILSVLIFAFFFVVGYLSIATTGTDLTVPGAETAFFGSVFLLVWMLGVINIMFIAPFFFGILILVVIAYVLVLVSLQTRQSLDRSLIADLQSDDATRRKRAIVFCGQRRLVQFEETLTTLLLSDPYADLRLDAYNALSQMNKPKLNLVLSRLAEVTDAEEKTRLVLLLGKMGDERLIDVLVSTYRNNADSTIRLAVLDSLSSLRSGKIADFLIKAIDNKGTSAQKLKMLDMLDCYEKTEFVEPLVSLQNAEADLEVRLRILTVLRDIKDIRCTELFLELLHDSDIAVRNLAAETLASLGVTVPVRETVKEIVKVPCKYCGTLIEVTDMTCDACGAPLVPH